MGDSTLLSNNLIHVIGKLNSERIDLDLSTFNLDGIYKDNTKAIALTSIMNALRIDSYLRCIIYLLNTVEEFYIYNEDEYIDINNFNTHIIMNRLKLNSLINTILCEGETKRSRSLVNLIQNIGKSKDYRIYKF